MSDSLPTPACSSLLLFGATGDLARRMLLPSLYNLDDEGLLAPGLRIVGSARSPLSDDAWRDMAAKSLEAAIPRERLNGEAKSRFLARLAYRSLDVTRPEGFGHLADALCGKGEGEGAPLAIFLSTAANLFEPTIAGLKGAGLAGETARIGLEKPLGHDLASSREINDAVAAAFPEPRIFRFDHYLGKETVQNLLALRFGNAMFEPLWNARGIDHVQITIAETVGLESRGEFYDAAGALRDMVQNHMLQLLSLVAMEPPAAFDGTAVRDEKVKVLRCLRTMDAAAAASAVVGQYGPGEVDGKAVGGYPADLGRPSNTETFVALTAFVDNWRWQGAPFYLRTGKRLAVRRSEIVVQFKPVPHSMFAGDGDGAALAPNRLLIRLQPEESIALAVMAKVPGLDRDGVRLREVSLDLSLASAFPDLRRRIAYERLLLDLIEGRPMLFVRRDEVEAQWRWIDAIRQEWSDARREPESYPAGSWGPAAADALLAREGVRWHD